MPGRAQSFLNNKIYHIFNKTIDHKIVFEDTSSCNRFLQILTYYRSTKSQVGLATLLRMRNKELANVIRRDITDKSNFKVEILAYCLMPNHYHLLVKQKQLGGISSYLSKTMNSFTRYHNERFHRKGPIFLTKFKAVDIRTEEQLLTVSRYIHLNPHTSKVVKSWTELFSYPWSSFKDFIEENKMGLANTDEIMDYFNRDIRRYIKFVLSR